MIVPQVGVAKVVEPANRLLSGGSSELRAVDCDLSGQVRKHFASMRVDIRERQAQRTGNVFSFVGSARQHIDNRKPPVMQSPLDLRTRDVLVRQL